MSEEFRVINEFPDYEINREGIVRRISDGFKPKYNKKKKSIRLFTGVKYLERQTSILVNSIFNTPTDVESLSDIGYPDYAIDYEGNVWSYRKHKWIEPRLIGRGYLSLSLYNKDGYKQFLVHRLLAIKFIPNKEHKPTVNHIDGDKLNNCILNIEWATHKENNTHAIYNNLRDSILNTNKVHEICEYIQESKEKVIRNIERKFDITWDQAAEIYHRRSWVEISKEYIW